MISEIVAAAPPVPGFQIEAGYAAFDVEDARRVFAGRQGGLHQGKRQVDLAGFRFQVSRGPCSVLEFHVEWPGQDYVAFALPDVAGALPVLRRYLQRLNVDRRGWLLFFDDDLEHEWLGVWPDSPAPHLHVYESLGG